MSSVGFDLGNDSCTVAIARQLDAAVNLTADVVLIDQSKRETPAAVSFDGSLRLFGASAAASSSMNSHNTVSQIKRLLGRSFSELQPSLPELPFVVTEGSDGSPLVHVNYLRIDTTFTPTQLLGMLLSHLKSIAEKHVGAPVVDCCIGIPIHFTDVQRKAVMAAANIAGLDPVRLLHETTAAALDYSTVLRIDSPPENHEQVNVAFVDVGHAATQISIAGFKKGEVRILAHAFDRSLGGRDFDEVLFGHFAGRIKEKYQIDVHQRPHGSRASFRLRKECRKIKEMLTSSPNAFLEIDSLMDGKDVLESIKRDEFHELSAELVERLRVPLETAIKDAKLSVDKIESFVLVGAGTRVPVIADALRGFFGKEPTRTINASECVARGCALQCAILKNRSHVPKFQVHDCFPLNIALSWTGSALEMENRGIDNSQTKIVFPKGNRIPGFESLTCYGSDKLSVDVMYADASEGKISTYSIGPFQSSEGELAKVIIEVHLDLHGIFSIESATILEEEGVEVPITTDNEPPKESTEMDTDVVSASRKNINKTTVPIVEHVYGGMLPEDLEKAVEREKAMAHLDREMEEIITMRNDVEVYANNMKSELESYQEILTEYQREDFLAKLELVVPSDFEYAEDETKDFYTVKLEELKKLEEILNTIAEIEQIRREPKKAQQHIRELEEQLKLAQACNQEDLSKVQADNDRMSTELVEMRNKVVAAKLAEENLSKVQLVNDSMNAELVELRKKAVDIELANENLRNVHLENEKVKAELFELRNKAPSPAQIPWCNVVERFEKRLLVAEEASRTAQLVANAAVANCNQVRLELEKLQSFPCMNAEVLADLQEQLAAERQKMELEFSAECLKLQNELNGEKGKRRKLEAEKIFYSSLAIGSSSAKEKELLIQVRKLQQERDALENGLCSTQAYPQFRYPWKPLPGSHSQVQPSQVQPTAQDTEETWTMVPQLNTE